MDLRGPLIAGAIIAVGGVVAGAIVLDRAGSSDPFPAYGTPGENPDPMALPEEVGPSPPVDAGALVSAGTIGPRGRSPDGQNRQLTIRNLTGQPIFYVHVSQPGEGWGEDWLGSATIAAGESPVLDADDGSSACIFDMKFILQDGSEEIAMAQDVCTISGINVGGG